MWGKASGRLCHTRWQHTPISNIHSPGVLACSYRRVNMSAFGKINRNSQWAGPKPLTLQQIHQLAAVVICMLDYCSLSMYVNKKPGLVSDEFLLHSFHEEYLDLISSGTEACWKIGSGTLLQLFALRLISGINLFLFLRKCQNCLSNENWIL